MKLFIFSRNIAAIVAALCLASGSLIGSEHHKSRHHSSSSNSCKSVKKQLHNVGHTLDRIEQLEKQLTSVAPTPITQKNIDRAGGVLTLCHSGDYCVTEDIKGVLVIGADSVCLDLCCHTLDAKGLPSAIIANGYQGLKVFDGRIIHSETAAIKIQNYSSVELYKLVMNNHSLDSIRIADSININVHDVDFINDQSGEHALLLSNCTNMVIKNCNASGFLSTIGAVIQLNFCLNTSIQDVEVRECIKSVASPAGSYDPASMLVCINGSPGTDLVHVKVSDNTVDTTAVGARRFAAIGFMNSPGGSLHRCQTNNNTDINGDVGNDITSFSGLDRQVFIGSSDNVTVTEHQANNNRCTVVMTDFRMYAPLDSLNVVFDGCQANNNSIAELAVNSVFDSYFAGFLVQFNAIRPDGAVVRNCQANFNTVVNGGSTRDPMSNQGLFMGIRLEGNGIIDSCQTSNNTFQDASIIPQTQVTGIYAVNAASATIINSSSDNNTGAETAAGITFFGDLQNASSCTIQSCSASSNGNYGLLIGNPFRKAGIATSNAEVFDSVFNQNGSAFGDAAGIFIFPGDVSISNVLIKGCQINDTSSGRANAAGILAVSASNVVIEDTDVFNTRADGAGHGILFDTLRDSKIIRTQVHGNQNSGVELVGVNTNVLILDSIAIDNDKGFSVSAGSVLENGVIQGNKALGNVSFGFEHAAVLPVPFDTGYQNNYAQDNGVNYSISNIIQLFNYSIPAATYTFVPNGASNYPTQANIDAS
ncbi:MAG: right-handed parallel beta-helix repeat-containing protein [Chlamydiales bacterium]|nr:right-handed parallel beta-helix repeat-containing protein [Chlamydiales bacterium]